MTSAPWRLTGPTRLERGLQALAQALTRHVDARIAARERRRQATLESVSAAPVEHDHARRLDIALLSLGSRPRP